MIFLSSDFIAVTPLLSVTVLSLVVLAVEALVKESERISYWVSIIGLALSGLAALLMLDLTGSVFNDMVTVGGTGYLFSALFIVSALVTIVLSRDYLLK